MREAYLLDAVRTPFGKRDGALKEIHPVDLLGGLLQGLLRRTRIEPGKVDDVIMGCVDQVGEQGPTSPAMLGCRPVSPSQFPPRRWIGNAVRHCKRFNLRRKA